MRPTTVILSTLAAALVGFGAAAVTLVTNSERSPGDHENATRAGAGGSAGSLAGFRDRVQVERPDEPVEARPTHSTLTIRVVGAGGTPFAGAAVRLAGTDAPTLPPTDEYGEVRHDAVIGAHYGVLATAQGLAGTPGRAWRQPEADHVVVIALEPTRSVHGIVVGQDGETPAEAVRVTSGCVVAEKPRMELPLTGGAHTDHAGRFVLPEQPRTVLELTAAPAGPRQGRQASGRVEAERPGGRGSGSASDPVRLRFGFVARHEIVVLDADTGGPLETDTVVVYTVGADGERTVHGMPSPARLGDGNGEAPPLALFHVAPGQLTRVLVHAKGYEESKILELAADPEETADERRHVLRLRKGGGDEAVVLLRISARPGTAPERLRLSWVHGGTWVTSEQEIVDGTITLRLPPGESRIEIGGASHSQDGGPPYLPLTVALDLRAGERLSREITLVTGGTVRIRRSDPDDRTRLPEPRAARDKGGAEHPVSARHGSDETSELLAIGPLPQGTWTIVFEDEKIPPIVAVVHAGETTDVLVR